MIFAHVSPCMNAKPLAKRCLGKHHLQIHRNKNYFLCQAIFKIFSIKHNINILKVREG